MLGGDCGGSKRQFRLDYPLRLFDLTTPAPVFGTNLGAEAHRQRNRVRARAGRKPVAIYWTSTRFGAPERSPTTIGANMIGRADAPERRRLRGRRPCARFDAAADPRPAVAD
jgi:hypothetical protein